MKRLLYICVLFSFCAKAQAPDSKVGPNAFTYTLPANEQVTSAGIYENGVLIRTLWSNKPGTTGKHIGWWDGRDDDGNNKETGHTYQVKISANNDVYTWEGVIGNTSAADTGATVWRGGSQICDMAITGNYTRCATGFSELNASQCKFKTPEAKILYSSQPSVTGQGSTNVCANGDNIFWGGSDYAGTHFFVFGENVSNDAESVFSAGAPYTGRYCRTYKSALDVSTVPITGMAVQQSGNRYLLVAHASSNSIDELNGTTGAFVRTISIDNPGRICFENDNTLWVCQGTAVVKYAVATDGSINNTGSQVTGLSNATGVSAYHGELAIEDAGNQQIVKFYNSATLKQTRTIGLVGGYSSTPVVANNRFYFSDMRGTLINFIKYDATGGIWIGDPGNCRVQHFNSAGNYVETIMYVPIYLYYVNAPNSAMCYNVNLCQTENTAVFSQLLEFKIDYAQPLSLGWKLKNNWGYNLPLGWINTGLVGRIASLSNGRRYVILNKFAVPYMCELASSGLRIGKALPQFATMDSVGNLYTTSRAGSTSVTFTYSKLKLTGFDADNNPTYSKPSVIASINLGSQEPLPADRGCKTTTSGKLILFDNGNSTARIEGQNYYHWAAYDTSAFKRLWRTGKSTFKAYSGDFPDDGAYDIGNSVNYGGGSCAVVGNHIFTNYHGEGWKGGQTGIVYVHNDIGLLQGIFGVLGASVAGKVAPYGYASNTLATNATTHGGDYFLYFNDESVHAGVHRWKISNTSSENTQTINLTLSDLNFTPAPDKTDLLTGVPNGQVSIMGVPGWTQNPAEDVKNNSNQYAPGQSYTVTRRETYDFTKSADIQFYTTQLAADRWWKRSTLQTENWMFEGKLDLTRGAFTIPETSKAKLYIEVTDINGKAISRIYFYGTQRLQFDGAFYGPYMQNKVNSSDFVLKRDGNSDKVFFQINLWGTMMQGSRPMEDVTADITHPANIGVYQMGNTNNIGVHIGINELFQVH